MAERLMVLPSKEVGNIRVVTVPEDMGSQEAYRYVTGLIADAERSQEDLWLEEVLELLEERGFEGVEFALGPTLD